MVVKELNKHYKKKEQFVQIIFKNFLNLENKGVNHNKQEIRRILNSEHYYGFAIYDKEFMIGYAISELMTLQDGRLCIYIYYLYVSSLYRKRGLGTTLIKCIKLKAKQLGISFIVLSCERQNENNMRFYRRLGFEEDKFQEGVKGFTVFTLRLD